MSAVIRSGADYYNVHLGFWTNWAHGTIQGATLTLTRRNGGFLIAFLALYVAYAGTSFWRVTCFALHWIFSSSSPQNGLYHQRQVIWRTATTANDGAWQFLCLIWAWRERKSLLPALLSFIPAFLLAFSTSILFIVAGIFSSRVTTETANEVLLSGQHCGVINEALVDDDFDNRMSIYDPYYNQRATAYLNYAAQCYTSAQNSEDCQLYPLAQLPFAANKNASCPFAKEICRFESGNIVLDTGFLDSQRHFGINARPQDRFIYRVVNKCAPLVTQGYRENFTMPYNDTGSPIIPVVRYHYGKSLSTGYPGANDSFTYEVPTNFTIDSYNSLQVAPNDFVLGVIGAYWPMNDTTLQTRSDFIPLDKIQQNDADVILIFLSSLGIQFVKEVDDPWYSAHREAGFLIDVATHKNYPTYQQDEPASPLGCTLQHQYCNPNLPLGERCEPLRGMWAKFDPEQSPHLWRTESERSTIRWIEKTFSIRASIKEILDATGKSALTARYGMWKALQGPLPPNQWQREVQHWFSASLASIQASFVETVTGPLVKEMEQFYERPQDTASQRLCKNQMILSTRYSSFSVLGLFMIIGLGTLIVIIDYTIEPVVGWLGRRWIRRHTTAARLSKFSQREWIINSVPHLHRLAYGKISWRRVDRAIPILDLSVRFSAVEEEPMGTPLRSCLPEKPTPTTTPVDAPHDRDSVEPRVISKHTGACPQPTSPTISRDMITASSQDSAHQPVVHENLSSLTKTSVSGE